MSFAFTGIFTFLPHPSCRVMSKHDVVITAEWGCHFASHFDFLLPSPHVWPLLAHSNGQGGKRKRKQRLDKVGSADKKAFRIQVDAYPRYAASALATNALVRCSFAGKSRVKMDPGVCSAQDMHLPLFLLAGSSGCLPIVWNTNVREAGLPVGHGPPRLPYPGDAAFPVPLLRVWQENTGQKQICDPLVR
nr:hypothetical protein B24B19.100 [imported] - Neurospora crassa [Neurospora crassa]